MRTCVRMQAAGISCRLFADMDPRRTNCYVFPTRSLSRQFKKEQIRYIRIGISLRGSGSEAHDAETAF